MSTRRQYIIARNGNHNRDADQGREGNHPEDDLKGTLIRISTPLTCPCLSVLLSDSPQLAALHYEGLHWYI